MFVLIGNVDPVGVMLNGSADEVANAVRKLLDEMSDVENFMLSTGCDLPYETPHENIGRIHERRKTIGIGLNHLAYGGE